MANITKHDSTIIDIVRPVRITAIVAVIFSAIALVTAVSIAIAAQDVDETDGIDVGFDVRVPSMDVVEAGVPVDEMHVLVDDAGFEEFSVVHVGFEVEFPRDVAMVYGVHVGVVDWT